MSLSETVEVSSISVPGSQLQCYWVQGIRESHDLTINLARDVSRDGAAAAAICNYEHNRLGHCIQIIWNIYKLSWTQTLSVANPVQYQEYEYDKGNIWVLIADVKIVMWTNNRLVLTRRTEGLGLWMECQACFCFMSSHHTLCCVYTQVHFKSQKSFPITLNSGWRWFRDNFIWIRGLPCKTPNWC